LSLATGQPQDAIDRLSLAVETHRATYAAHAVLLRALIASGDVARARTEAAWIASHRGQAYGEYGHEFMWQATNVVESNLALLAAHQLAAEAGDFEAAESNMEAFRTAWPGTEGEAAASARARSLAR
jgi:hypothetical protein